MVFSQSCVRIGWAMLMVTLAACSVSAPSTPTSTPTRATPIGIANPASTYCIQQGGRLEIRKTTQGETGYCIFPDGSECEEWMFMRGECKPGVKPVTVTQADNGKTVEVAKGGTLIVILEGNPGSTGYAWGLEAGNEAILKSQGDPRFTTTSNLPGAPGTFEFKFTAVSVGTATLKFVNKRPWEPNDPNVQTFSVTVNVK